MNSSPKTILFVATDLMLTSTVSGFASAAGVGVRVISTVSEMSEVDVDFDNCLVLIDLGLPGLDISALTQQLSAHTISRAIAYGPHVHTEKLRAATDAGVGAVLSRGQFSAQVGQLIRTFAADDTA